eukprot:1655214-Ditylum_brightwellii.AAC.1
MKVCRHQYEKLQEDLHNDLSKGTNNYPDTLDAAFRMINKRRDRTSNRSTSVNHTMSFMTDSDNKKKKEEEKKKKKKREEGRNKPVVPPKNGGPTKENIVCNKCGHPGHYPSQCPKQEEAVTALCINSHDNDSNLEGC